ncbi:MAG: glutamate synthase [Saprospiraceae bacterium]|nr:MAG: glutamate synthase [Saprospiraceae bacterium]
MKEHIVAIFGGAVSGAEAAHQLTQHGIRCVVFEQNALPYGKIEDGLPKWHVKLRDKEEANIDEKLRHPLVTFAPQVRLGRDLDFKDVVNWGFSAIFLATGAWRDRPLAIPGIDDYIGKGFYYQNPFIYWYNHKHEPDFAGPHCEVADGALIVGGGLASIDVAKAIMMELVEKALALRGHHVTMFDLERGIDKVLEGLGLSLQDLGLKGCTLVYRRRIKDMPLFPGETDTPEKLAKAEAVREKVLMNAKTKFLFDVLPCHVPVDKVVENGRLAGLVLRQTRIENGRVVEIPGTEKEFRAPLVISSIGSIPEPIPGIPMHGQVYDVEEGHCCRLKGFRNVFALGNAVTGRGNIKESMEHGRTIAQMVAENYLLDAEATLSEAFRKQESKVDAAMNALEKQLEHLEPPSPRQAEAIFEKVRALQQKVGYDGDYDAWIARHKPVRLEQLLGLAEH